MNKQLIALQTKHSNIAGSGNKSIKAKHWMSKILTKKHSKPFADDNHESANRSSSSLPPSKSSQLATLQDSNNINQNRKDNEKQKSYGTVANNQLEKIGSERSEPLLNYSPLQEIQNNDEKGEQENSILESKTPPKKRKIFNHDMDKHKLTGENEDILTFEKRDGSIGFNASIMTPDFNYALFDVVSACFI